MKQKCVAVKSKQSILEVIQPHFRHLYVHMQTYPIFSFIQAKFSIFIQGFKAVNCIYLCVCVCECEYVGTNIIFICMEVRGQLVGISISLLRVGPGD